MYLWHTLRFVKAAMVEEESRLQSFLLCQEFLEAGVQKVA